MTEKHRLMPFLLICLIGFAAGQLADRIGRIGRTAPIIARMTAPTTS